MALKSIEIRRRLGGAMLALVLPTLACGAGGGPLAATPPWEVPSDGGGCVEATQEGGIAPEMDPRVIQKVVRAQFSAMRNCFLAGLERNWSVRGPIRGRVTTKFVIGLDGTVTSSQAVPSVAQLPDATAVACVVAEFGKLTFPRPRHRPVTVVYPIQFDEP
jgi:hypothetical protein